jgi:protein ImuB
MVNSPPPRKRRWTHRLWIDGPKEIRPFQAQSTAPGVTHDASRITPPLILIRTIATRQLVVAVFDRAHSSGIRPGMSLAQARALCAHVTHLEHDPARDVKSLHSLARWMIRYSPAVTPVIPPDGAASAPITGHFGLFLDITGSDRLFHGLDNLLRQVADSLRRFNLSASIALAPTPAAAWALTFSTGVPSSIENQNSTIEKRLAPLPIAALRLPDKTLASLHHLGLTTISQLLAIPRDQLPARFGPLLLQRLDQALGRIPETLIPLPYHAPIEAHMDFDGLVESVEALWMVFKDLIARLCTDMARRGCGARKVELQFLRAYAATLHKTIHLSRPSRNPAILFNLFRCALETIGTDDGFLGLKVAVSEFEPLAEEQIDLLEHEEHAGEVELAHLIERLRLRLGQESLLQVNLFESHLPEKAYALGERANPQSKIEIRKLTRPLHLLPMPLEIPVMVSPSDDRDGRPILLTLHGNPHRVVHWTGPERIAGLWWEGHCKTRDYFEIEIPDGRRLWLFRVVETGKWYLHGVFE